MFFLQIAFEFSNIPFVKETLPKQFRFFGRYGLKGLQQCDDLIRYSGMMKQQIKAVIKQDEILLEENYRSGYNLGIR